MTATTSAPLAREDFPPRRPGQLGWVLHSGGTTIRVADLPDTDWPGTLEFLAKYGKRGWEFCSHEPAC
jgi:hypothetical protein